MNALHPLICWEFFLPCTRSGSLLLNAALQLPRWNVLGCRPVQLLDPPIPERSQGRSKECALSLALGGPMDPSSWRGVGVAVKKQAERSWRLVPLQAEGRALLKLLLWRRCENSQRAAHGRPPAVPEGYTDEQRILRWELNYPFRLRTYEESYVFCKVAGIVLKSWETYSSAMEFL